MVYKTKNNKKSNYNLTEVTIQNLLGLFLMVANDDRVLQKISDEDMKVIEKIVQSLKK